MYNQTINLSDSTITDMDKLFMECTMVGEPGVEYVITGVDIRSVIEYVNSMKIVSYINTVNPAAIHTHELASHPYLLMQVVNGKYYYYGHKIDPSTKLRTDNTFTATTQYTNSIKIQPTCMMDDLICATVFNYVAVIESTGSACYVNVACHLNDNMHHITDDGTSISIVRTIQCVSSSHTMIDE